MQPHKKLVQQWHEKEFNKRTSSPPLLLQDHLGGRSRNRDVTDKTGQESLPITSSLSIPIL
ncbi:MAG: hypothetical protein WCD53_28250 [Microcoleus sp.]